MIITDDIYKAIYAAGFIDSEGTVTLIRKNKKTKFRRPVVSVSSTTIGILEDFKKAYGGSISTHKTYKEHHKKSWVWKVDNDAALRLLDKVIPYMKEPTKIYRAELLLSEYKSVTPRNGKYSKQKLQAKLDFEKRFFELP